MKTIKRICGVLLACLTLMSMLSVGVFAAGTQDDPIDAATKWFGYGVNTYLLNPSIAEGSDGMWYTLTADQEGILVLEHSYKNVDYTITITVNGRDYVGGCVDGVPYNRPIMTLPLQVGDVATVAIVTKDAAAGTVYASMNISAGDTNNTVKVKSEGIDVYVGAGQTVYFQDDSLQASYATKGLLVEGDVADTVFYAIHKIAESGSATEVEYTDTDADGIIEATLGGSQGSAGAPAVKPAWAIKNDSAEDRCYTLTVVDKAHECVYDDDTDADCNSCGAIREVGSADSNPFEFTGNSVSADVNGLAFRFDVDIEGLDVNGEYQADYSNATIGGKKITMMGAVLSSNGSTPSLEGLTGYMVDIPAAKACLDYDTPCFAVRVIHIPENQKDTVVNAIPYYILEDGTVVYGEMVSASYNNAAE